MNEVLATVITPVNENLEPDTQNFANHCRWLMHNGVGLAGFGTNPETNSMSTGEKVGFTMDDLKERTFCKTKIFVQNQGMREILPQAYD